MNNALLVPTDFSENANTAIQYAANLALKFNWDVHILHVYQTFGRNFASQEFNDEIIKHNENSALQEMYKTEKKIKSKFPTINFSCACVEGNLTETILKVAEDNSAPFIIMGFKGAGAIKSILIGSNTFEIIQQSSIGVIAVPQSYHTFSLNKIGMLTNFKQNELQLISSFINRTSPSLDLTLLHADEANKTIDLNSIIYWQEQIIKKTGIVTINYRSKEYTNRLDVNEPIPYIIKKLIEEEEIDLLLVSYMRKSFFSSLFSKSLVKSLANEMTVPTYFLDSRL